MESRCWTSHRFPVRIFNGSSSGHDPPQERAASRCLAKPRTNLAMPSPPRIFRSSTRWATFLCFLRARQPICVHLAFSAHCGRANAAGAVSDQHDGQNVVSVGGFAWSLRVRGPRSSHPSRSSYPSLSYFLLRFSSLLLLSAAPRWPTLAVMLVRRVSRLSTEHSLK